MPQKIKKFFLLFLLIEMLFAYSPAFAQTPVPYDYSKAGVSSQIKDLLCAPPDTGASTSGVLYQCINQLYKFAIVLASVIGVFFIVIAGYVYMSADGNSEAVDKAKSIIESTIVSLVILIAGYILLRAINPDLIQFHNVQPPTADLSSLFADLDKANVAFSQDKAFTPAEIRGCKSQNGTLEGGYYRFSQCNGSWASTPYTRTDQVCKEDDGSGSTIGTSGCGPTSLATVLKNYSVNVDPAAIAAEVVKDGGRVCGQGTKISTLAQVAHDHGMTTTAISDASTALSTVRGGGIVLASMGPGIFTAGGHFIVIYGVSSDGSFLIADSGPRNITKASAQDITASFKGGIKIQK